jgi:hypothetical protein
MTHPIVNAGKIKIKEGSVLLFKVLNIVTLQDSREYYILEDQNGVKHFIDAEMYANYGIEVSKKIECKVVKINCTGRIILEPTHPIYSEGQSYFFCLVSKEEKGRGVKLHIEDIFRNKIEMDVPSGKLLSSNQGNFIKCRVKRLRKGVPEIEIMP